MRKSDLKIRANDICRASNRLPRTEIPKIKRALAGDVDVVKGPNYPGTYVNFWDAVRLCQTYSLPLLEKELRTWRRVVPRESELSEFIEITEFACPVMVRRSDLRINATNIFKLTGLSNDKLRRLKDRIDSQAYDVLRATQKRYQGTYVSFSVGIELCRDYGLHQVEQRLQSMKQTSEGPMKAVLPGHARSRSHTHLEEPIGSETIADGPMQAEGAHEPVPSIRCAKDAASSRQSEPKTRHSLLELAKLPSRSAENVQYEVWDSRPQLSELTEVEPDLRPSTWKTASHYGSFGDLFAPI